MTVNTADRARRISERWTRDPDRPEADVTAEVDAEITAENEVETERIARATEFSDSLAAFLTCRACRSSTATASADGYCDDCRAAAYVLRGLDALDDLIGKRTRRELIEADLDARQKAGN